MAQVVRLGLGYTGCWALLLFGPLDQVQNSFPLFSFLFCNSTHQEAPLPVILYKSITKACEKYSLIFFDSFSFLCAKHERIDVFCVPVTLPLAHEQIDMRSSCSIFSETFKAHKVRIVYDQVV